MPLIRAGLICQAVYSDNGTIDMLIFLTKLSSNRHMWAVHTDSEGALFVRRFALKHGIAFNAHALDEIKLRLQEIDMFFFVNQDFLQ